SWVPVRLAFLVSLSFARLLLAALVHAPSRSFKTTLMALQRQLRPRQDPASDSGVGQSTSGNSAQVSPTDGNGATSSDTSPAGSGGAGSLRLPTSDAAGSTSSSTIDTYSGSTYSSTSSTRIMTTSSTSSSTVISTSSTSTSTFSTTSAPRSTMSLTLMVTSTSSIPPSSNTISVRCRHTTILITYTTNMPTSVASSDSGSSANINRTALIAGVTTAAVVLAALALGAVFIYKRAQKRRIGFMETIKRMRREGKCAGAVGLLDDEFEDTTHQRYRDLQNTPVSIPRSMHALSPPPSEPSNYSTASLVRGDSGSMFREEVWPPPRDPSIEDDPFRWRGGGMND
ncbi:hypothetical protein IW261DRAFT_1508429, partial [Armillaria novae-zelandiae]